MDPMGKCLPYSYGYDPHGFAVSGPPPTYTVTTTHWAKPHHRLISLVPLRLLKRRRVRYGRAYLRSLCDAR